jgi:hypothetical protein
MFYAPPVCAIELRSSYHLQTVNTEYHKTPAEANGVLTLGDPIIDLKFFLGDALRGIRNTVKERQHTRSTFQC